MKPKLENRLQYSRKAGHTLHIESVFGKPAF